jgi:integrase
VIETMPRPRPPHLLREITRHKRAVWYARVGHGPRIRLKAPYGTPEFQAEYEAAIKGERVQSASTTPAGSLQWLYDRYRETAEWASLSPATRRQRENIMLHVLAKNGDADFRRITPASIASGMDRRKETPAQAQNFLKVMRSLFKWAHRAGHVALDPTSSVKDIRRKRTEGFKAWTEDDVVSYEARWPLGTKERVWLHVLLFTGLRRGDAVMVGKQHVKNGVIYIRTQKSGYETEVPMPLHRSLAATLEAGPTGDLHFICGESGKPLTKESFGNLFREACNAAGVKKSAHGLRKLAATRYADAGATVAELEALFGWHGGGMASLYTRDADRRRLAQQAAAKLARTSKQRSIPARRGK